MSPVTEGLTYYYDNDISWDPSLLHRQEWAIKCMDIPWSDKTNGQYIHQNVIFDYRNYCDSPTALCLKLTITYAFTVSAKIGTTLIGLNSDPVCLFPR